METTRPRQGGSCTIVIQLGASSILHEATHQLLLSTLTCVVEAIVRLRKDGHKVVLVSSGTVGVGWLRMALPSKPRSLSGNQALAAVGQGRMIALWDNLFTQLDQPIAQVLLTRGDISERTRYLNAVNAFRELLSMGVVPIVTENDTVAVSDIKFGDNDILSAVTSSMLQADYLFLLTDVDGLYTSNPRKDSSAKLIQVVQSIATVRDEVSTETLGSGLGTGGMEKKLIAAEIATAAGVTTIITSSKHAESISNIVEFYTRTQRNQTPEPLRSEGTNVSQSQSPQEPSCPPHTLFLPSSNPLRDLKSWTSHTLHPAGTVIIDSGAHSVLSRRESGGRLLPAGVLGIKGAFAAGQAVRIVVPRLPDGTWLKVRRTGKSSCSSGTCTPSCPPTPSEALDGASQCEPTELLVYSDLDFERGAIELIEVGRGLANYNSVQVEQVKGLNSSHIPRLLGYADSEYVIENVTIRVTP